jgi:rare lipoprotein A
MKSKIYKHQKSSLKIGSKKSILLFLCVAFVALASSQNLINDKQKKVVLKDTIKNSKMLLHQQELTIDSLFVVNGNFKFYKKGARASYYADKFHGRKTASGKNTIKPNIQLHIKNCPLEPW